MLNQSKQTALKNHRFMVAIVLLAIVVAFLGNTIIGMQDETTNLSSTETSTPRFTAESKTYEVVGIIGEKDILLYLDTVDTNEPVKEASLELAVNGTTVSVEEHEEGIFEATLPVTPTEITKLSLAVIKGETREDMSTEVDFRAESDSQSGTNVIRWLLGMLMAVLCTAILFSVWRVIDRYRATGQLSGKTGADS